ncbi:MULTISPECIES: hypothetical protein [unclassified Microbacterium]|uniref:hypothetical protein n=1 Tax=unclassified Microbacterium TaxID=2609290 RepID=UPI003867624A
MSAQQLAAFAADKTHFESIDKYVEFAQRVADFRAEGNLQAEIISRSTPQYRFFQFGEDAAYQFTRPVNTNLFHQSDQFDDALRVFVSALECAKDGGTPTPAQRSIIPTFVYTMQQSIGLALDALPAGQANNARKVNGDLFERLVQMLFRAVGTKCKSGIIRVPVRDDAGAELFSMSYQHDLIVEAAGEVKIIGSVKTSSKDRMAKVFVDQFLYNRLTETSTPHIAVFLNDVQRAGTAPNFRTAQTFLRGTFKGYTLKLNPLAGVYYADILPIMQQDPLLVEHIHTLDRLFFDDLPVLLAAEGVPAHDAEIEQEDA